jgi:hypothetical protein
MAGQGQYPAIFLEIYKNRANDVKVDFCSNMQQETK